MDAKQRKRYQGRTCMHNSPENSGTTQVQPRKINSAGYCYSAQDHKDDPRQQQNIKDIIKSGSARAFSEKAQSNFFYPAPVKDLVKNKEYSDNQPGPFMKGKAVEGSRIHQQQHCNCDQKTDNKFEDVHYY
jgi:hypothetical protein